MKKFLVATNQTDPDCNDFRVVEVVEVNGYHVGDRLLEDVMFDIKINKKNQFEVSVTERCAEYFKNLNAKKWKAAVKDYCEENDIFQSKDGLEAVCYDDSKPPKEQNWNCRKIPNIIGG